MAPNHVSARVQLALLQQQMGLDKEALTTLAEGGGRISSYSLVYQSVVWGVKPRLLQNLLLSLV